jgi:ATP-dependent DNA ligase
MHKKILRKLIPQDHSHLLYVDYCEDGDGLFRLVCENDLEGIVMKPKASPYADNRWVKVKNPNYSQAKDRHQLFNRK